MMIMFTSTSNDSAMESCKTKETTWYLLGVSAKKPKRSKLAQACTGVLYSPS